MAILKNQQFRKYQMGDINVSRVDFHVKGIMTPSSDMSVNPSGA